MDAEATVAVSAAVLALTQICKWAGIPDKYGPIAVLALSLIGVVFWGWSTGTFERTQAFAYFAGWISVATGAAGLFGFSRASAGALARALPPPANGAGESPTIKE